MLSRIRNFAIIAHIDAGKSTLADRMLELTHTIEERKMREQFLDKMELEREKGITIKLQPIRMEYEYEGKKYILNLIDTPGHVDFSYEVSRSLAAVEGAILLVDAKKGIQAQTIAHLEEAKKQNLVIIPVINKIDLPEIELEKVILEVKNFLGIKEKDILLISAKTGENVEELVQRIVIEIPPPKGGLDSSPRALIFDSYYDQYKGVIAYARIVDGNFEAREKIYFSQGKIESEILDIGYLGENFVSKKILECGEIGYFVTNLKDLNKVRVGDTIISAENADKTVPLSGYESPKHFVYADFYTEEGDGYPKLREALEKLSLNDASLVFEPSRGQKIMGRGFRLGFLGMLHLEIVKERLIREHNVDVYITPPMVSLRYEKNGKMIELKDLFDYDNQAKIEEPYINLEIITPARFLGMIMESLAKRRAKQLDSRFLSEDLTILEYELPLSEVIINFYDELKSISKGFASMSYNMRGYRESELVRLDVLIASDLVPPLSRIVSKKRMASEAKEMAIRLKKLIPRQNFQVAIQVCFGGRILAREDIPAFRKDVIAKLYGGDRTRKDKLLKKQAKGKKRMKRFGKVDIPSDVFLKMLKK